jgi:hypothetical protein
MHCLAGGPLCVPKTSSGNDTSIGGRNSLFLRQNSLFAKMIPCFAVYGISLEAFDFASV